MTTRQKALEILRGAGQLPDDRLDLAEMALALAALDVPEAGFEPYRHHLAEIAAAVADETAARSDEALGLAEKLDILRGVLVARHGYAGDSETYEDMQNANLMRVIDRRKGLPVALGILFIHAARAQGWDMVGLNFPGHFLVRLEHDGERVILDPFNGASELSPQELRDLLKQTAGAGAEMTPEHFAAVGNREVLVRLQNNLKLRHLRNDRADKAAEVVEHMLLFAPDHPGLWREAGLFNARVGNLGSAIRAFEKFMEMGARLGASPQLMHQTAAMVQQLRSRLN